MDGKSAKKGTKTGKNRTQNVKKVEKTTKSALAHLNIRVPCSEKTAPGTGTARAVAGRTPAPGLVVSQKSPKNHPQNLLQKVIHNRRRA